MVATDDERIASVVRGFGGEVLLTSPAHPTGTDRLAEAARALEAEIVVNVQGDEPMLDPAGIDAAAQALLADEALEMATLSLPLVSVDEMLAPSVVKVVTDARGDALYFSRAPIPYVRQGAAGRPPRAAERAVARGLARKHVGLYVYRREALLRFASLPPSPLEEAEGLEQLRALEHGMRIRVVPVAGAPASPSTHPRTCERVRGAPRSREGKKRLTKYIFVTGGVVSSLGKGLAAASIGALLEGHGFKVAMMKCDPYLNVDPGTMSPYQHGEVYVTEDGAETDLDLGHYERFTHCETSKDSNITTGKIYGSVIAKERRGDYLGRTVQVIPHITDEIKTSIRASAKDVDVLIVEIGGTVGDIESLPFLEAVRQFRQDVGRENAIVVHLALVPYIATAHELKTKPMQHSVRELRAIGISPNVLLCRTDRVLSPTSRPSWRSSATSPRRPSSRPRTCETIYEVPLVYSAEGLDTIVSRPWTSQRRPRHGGLGELVERHASPEGRGHDRHRRQVRLLRGLVQEPQRGPLARRLRQPGEGRAALGRVRRARLGERGREARRRWTASSCRAASAPAAPAAWWPPPSTRARPARPTSASATASSGP